MLRGADSEYEVLRGDAKLIFVEDHLASARNPPLSPDSREVDPKPWLGQGVADLPASGLRSAPPAPGPTSGRDRGARSIASRPVSTSTTWTSRTAPGERAGRGAPRTPKPAYSK
ncbi:uncharacterized protein LOC129145302 isoform X2 [Talpa occidentalis]|uniref:uncharacterized protein LOC129145302 isoform X2 n=1 Tax=Talpa occidentalis TaxID=50954 RepID=UPI0023F9B109|nr:uncharacterized protein LOC129145302 isoform X2 [Talpa occidentalis]